MSYKALHFPKLKRRSNYSGFRKYSAYREEIRVDCQGRCVYCDVHENEIGGSDFMTLDHFRPKDKYIDLMHNPNNLVWCCHVCNNSKGNIWPAYGTPYTFVRNGGFIDPFAEDMKEYFDISMNGELNPLKHPARFIIDNLELNRSGAKRIRELRNQKYESKKLFEAYLQSALESTDFILKDNSATEEAKSAASQHRKYLEETYQLGSKSFEIDFNLY